MAAKKRRTTRGGRTAAEIMAELQRDPEYQARRAEEAAQRAERVRQWREAAEPLIQELGEAGVCVQSPWDLVPRREPYRDALPILLRHLERPYPSRVREGIARALAVPDPMVRDAWPRLIRLYRAEPPGEVRQAVALILANSARPDDLDTVLGLLRDPRLGESRGMLVGYLEKHARAMPRAQKALMALGDDPQLHLEVQDALKRNRRREKERLRARERRAAKRREKEAAKRRGDRNAGED